MPKSSEKKSMQPVFFKTPAEFNSWLKKHHATETELLVGYYKKDSGKPSITWPESVDEALCYGWIDGIRRSIDEKSYSIRFTPRKKTSTWSKVNIAKIAELKKQGRLQQAGIDAWERRSDKRSGIYSFEQENTDLDAASLKKFKANKSAWKFFSTAPASYRKAATWWVISAKQEATRERRLKTLIADSEQELRIKPLRR